MLSGVSHKLDPFSLKLLHSQKVDSFFHIYCCIFKVLKYKNLIACRLIVQYPMKRTRGRTLALHYLSAQCIQSVPEVREVRCDPIDSKILKIKIKHTLGV